MRNAIVLITGAAPYLGGAATWEPLRRTMPECTFVEIESLDFAGAANVADACRALVKGALSDASAVLAHGAVARPVFEALAERSPQIPLLLLSPLYVSKSTAISRFARSIIATPIGRRLLAKVANGKLRRLRSDETFLKEQLATFVGADFISSALLAEANARVQDPRMELSVQKTAEVVLSITEPLQPSVEATVSNVTVLLGSSLSDRKMARRIKATTLSGVVGAAMIEAPGAVAAVLRAMLSASETAP